MFAGMVPMARIERATSPLPRECSTTEPHGRRHGRAHRDAHARGDSSFALLEREAGIEPASLAWKAKVLPLNYSRADSANCLGGGGWIRTSVGVSQQIYSLPPLATRAPLRGELAILARTALLAGGRVDPASRVVAHASTRARTGQMMRPVVMPRTMPPAPPRGLRRA